MNYHIHIVTSLQEWPREQAFTFFNSADWASLLSKEPGAKPILAVASDTEHRIVLVQNVLIMRQSHLLPFKYGVSAVMWGEPQCFKELTDAVDCYTQVLKALVKYCKHKALFLEARHFAATTSWLPAFQNLGFRILPWYNVLNDLQPDKSPLDSVSDRRQRQIKAAIRAGAKIVTKPTSCQWQAFYAILKRHYHEIHRPLPSYATFKNFYEHADFGYCIVVLAPDDTVIGGIACLHATGPVAYAWYTAGLDRDKRYAPYCASLLSNYAAIAHAQSLNCTCFDFQGAGPQGKPYGVRDFKLRFGGRLIETYRFRKIL